MGTGIGRCGLRPSVPQTHTGEKKNSPVKDEKDNNIRSIASHSSYTGDAELLQRLIAWTNIEDQLRSTYSDMKVDRVCSQRVQGSMEQTNFNNSMSVEAKECSDLGNYTEEGHRIIRIIGDDPRGREGLAHQERDLWVG